MELIFVSQYNILIFFCQGTVKIQPLFTSQTQVPTHPGQMTVSWEFKDTNVSNCTLKFISLFTESNWLWKISYWNKLYSTLKDFRLSFESWFLVICIKFKTLISGTPPKEDFPSFNVVIFFSIIYSVPIAC